LNFCLSLLWLNVLVKSLHLSFPNPLNFYDKVIYNLYGLNDEDIREVELWYCRRYSKLAEAQGEIDVVKEKYHDYLSQCDRLADSRITKDTVTIKDLSVRDPRLEKVLVRSGALDSSHHIKIRQEDLN
jgi:hypothetical protein